MKRRDFIKSATATGIFLSAGTLSGCTHTQPSSVWLDKTITRLGSLKQRVLVFDGPWQAYATFSHLAQSIEFSITGFPEHKSNGFKAWVGNPAFNVFKTIGSMTHDTAEPIPGADKLDHTTIEAIAIDASIDRVINALQSFNQSDTTLPHFAYGDLSHDDYLIAHLLHIEDHLNLLT